MRETYRQGRDISRFAASRGVVALLSLASLRGLARLLLFSPRRAALLALLLSAGLTAACAHAQQASPPAAVSERAHSPRGALLRAAAAPGWGQIYNGQYLKLPFVYGGLGGAGYLTVLLTDEYVLYRRAARFAQGVSTSGRSEEAYQTLLARFGVESIQASTLVAQRDNLRRNRDLSVLGVGLVYALTVLDAYVSAHLMDFDVGEDLTVGFAPVPGGVRARAVW